MCSRHIHKLTVIAIEIRNPVSFVCRRRNYGSRIQIGDTRANSYRPQPLSISVVTDAPVITNKNNQDENCVQVGSRTWISSWYPFCQISVRYRKKRNRKMFRLFDPWPRTCHQTWNQSTELRMYVLTKLQHY